LLGRELAARSKQNGKSINKIVDMLEQQQSDRKLTVGPDRRPSLAALPFELERKEAQ
jgi:hypothetical protein